MAMRKPALLIASLLLSLLTVELGLRGLGWGQTMLFTPDPNFGYLMTPNQVVYTAGHPVRINSLGLRGPELAQVKSKGQYRILFIGDSVTYGGGAIWEADLFCRVVESELRQKGREVEAVNLSAPGWSPQNWSRYVEETGLSGADVVVVVLPACDLARPFATMEDHHFRREAPVLRLQALLERAQRLLSSRWTASGRASAGGQSHGPQQIVNLNLRAVSHLASICRKEAIPMIAVFVPSAGYENAARYWPSFASVLPTVVDLSGELAPDQFRDGVHLNANGHRKVADALAGKINGLLGSGQAYLGGEK